MDLMRNTFSAGRRKQLGDMSPAQYFGTPGLTDAFNYNVQNLRRKCLPTTENEMLLMNLRDRLIASLGAAWIRGYGLAAIQIGIPLQAAWYRLPNADWTKNTKEVLLWNPEILECRGIRFMPNEGCLSIPRKSFLTRRWKYMKVRNGDGTIIESDGMEALILQHEIGHMQGQLCIDFVVKDKEETKIGRNDPCPCGSGKKYKVCCTD